MSAIDDARKLYDLRVVAGMPDNKRQMVCPLPMHSHQNFTPSFSIFTKQPGSVQYFRCHGSCGKSGDSVDLVGYMRISGYDPSNGDMVKRAIALLQSGYQISPPKQQAKRITGLPLDVLWSMPAPDLDIYAYAAERGLDPETLDRFQVRTHEVNKKKYMAMPTLHFGRLVGIKLRNIDATGVKGRFMFYPGSSNGLFNYSGVFAQSQPLLIVKAEIPAMLLLQHGIHACAPSGSENTISSELFQAMAWAMRRVVVKDNDPDPGVREKMDKFAARRAKTFQAQLTAPPEQYKDIDEWVLAEPEQALKTIRSWLK